VELLNFILHFDEYLIRAIQEFGSGTYAILFFIVFAETGFVITPFLPGDSLLFAAGTLAGSGLLELWPLIATLLAAAIIGDSVNYYIGSRIGPRVFARENSRLFNPAYLAKTQSYYDKHGGKTIIIARFVPIVRTFAPFVAGVGRMEYGKFLYYNVVGGILWVVGLTLAGFFFGSLSFVKHNFEIAVIVIVILSLLPGLIEYFKHRKANNAQMEASFESPEND
jgi:membrane-associated protein